MKTMKTHVGNITLTIRNKSGSTQLLLGLKKRKKKNRKGGGGKVVGRGRWVPPGGGKEDSDKSHIHGAQRELQEETGIRLPLHAFRRCGTLIGYFEKETTPRWKVFIYIAKIDSKTNFRIESEAYEKMNWFNTGDLPLSQMIESDREWMPRMLKGEKLTIIIHQTEDHKTISFEIRKWTR
jgi:8-oxo-dGTP pyrophosphatase MutT (NUDIX family)